MHAQTDIPDNIPDASDCKFESLPMLSFVLATDNTKSVEKRYTYSPNAEPNSVLAKLTANGLLYGDIEELFEPYIPKFYMAEDRASNNYLHIAVFQHKQSTQDYVDFLIRTNLLKKAPQYNIYETGNPGYYDISLLFDTKAERDAFAENRAAWFDNSVQ